MVNHVKIIKEYVEGFWSLPLRHYLKTEKCIGFYVELMFCQNISAKVFYVQHIPVDYVDL